MTDSDRRRRFRDLHRHGCFVLPNPWDIGSARILESLGARALATTSSGHAASLGRPDQEITRAELVAHLRQLVVAVDLPISVDAERGFAHDPAGVAETVGLLADAGAAGCSIEDWDPEAGAIDDVRAAAERVAAAAEVARARGLVLTARAEQHLHGTPDLDDTIARLLTYRDAGAEVLYAPGLRDLDAIRRVAAEVGVPLNVLALAGGPTVPELAGAGARRVSVGGALAFTAYGALARAARELLDDGTLAFAERALSHAERAAAFRDRADDGR